MPARPPPITRADWVTGTETVGTGCLRDALATAILRRSMALRVAISRFPMCTHEHWSRMLAISKSCGFRPASRMVSWKRGSWVLGVHDATTTRFRAYSLMISTIFFWVSCEQV